MKDLPWRHVKKKTNSLRADIIMFIGVGLRFVKLKAKSIVTGK